MSKALIIICSYSVVVFTSVVLMLGVGISQGKKVWAKSLEALSFPPFVSMSLKPKLIDQIIHIR